MGVSFVGILMLSAGTRVRAGGHGFVLGVCRIHNIALGRLETTTRMSHMEFRAIKMVPEDCK